jgi:uncharacterized membrane protein
MPTNEEQNNNFQEKNMTYNIKLYIATLLAFFAIDMVWLGVVAQPFYQSQIGWLLSPNPIWWAAILFYLLFLVGVEVFILLPGLKADSLKSTLLHAALFGAVTYATYDLTNLATVKDWPLIVTVVDMVWGTTVTVLISAIGFWAGKRLK